MKLRDLEGEEETPIKWRDFKIETLIAIRSDNEKYFVKLARKQGLK